MLGIRSCRRGRDNWALACTLLVGTKGNCGWIYSWPCEPRAYLPEVVHARSGHSVGRWVGPRDPLIQVRTSSMAALFGKHSRPERIRRVLRRPGRRPRRNQHQPHLHSHRCRRKSDKTWVLGSDNAWIHQEQKDWEPQSMMMIQDSLKAIRWAWILIQISSRTPSTPTSTDLSNSPARILSGPRTSKRLGIPFPWTSP